MKHSPFAGAASFAHLIGLRPKGKKAEDEDTKPDDKKGKKAEEDGDDAAAEQEDEEEQASEGEDDERCEEEDDEEQASQDDEDDGKAKGKNAKGKNPKGASGTKDKTYADGRAAERKRCAAIFAAPEAAGQPHVAAKLAFTTNLSAKEAIGVLAETASTQPEGKRGLGQRMATVPNPNPGADGGSAPEKGSAAETIARMTAVYDRATNSGKK